MKTSVHTAVLASAAATLFAAGIAINCAAADEAKVQCGGVTGCRGESDCKTAANACKGQNSCMGVGFKWLSKAECEKRGGKISE